jgi:glutathione S-transferase
MALNYAAVGVELREVLLKDKPQSMLTASPKGTVPVLILPDGSVIDESIEIMRWALNRNDPDHWWR